MSDANIDDAKVIGDDGQFHATDEAVDLSHTTFEGWAALALFWALGGVVFYQFITRYALNNSASWTEEIARYLLVATVFVGAAIGVAKNNHIQVDLLYRYLPKSLARAMSTAVDVIRIVFFAAMALLQCFERLRLGTRDGLAAVGLDQDAEQGVGIEHGLGQRNGHDDQFVGVHAQALAGRLQHADDAQPPVADPYQLADGRLAAEHFLADLGADHRH